MKTTKVKLMTKHGLPFLRFETTIGPDDWTELDLTDKQLLVIENDCKKTVAEGGVFRIDPVPDWDAARARERERLAADRAEREEPSPAPRTSRGKQRLGVTVGG